MTQSAPHLQNCIVKPSVSESLSVNLSRRKERQRKRKELCRHHDGQSSFAQEACENFPRGFCMFPSEAAIATFFLLSFMYDMICSFFCIGQGQNILDINVCHGNPSNFNGQKNMKETCSGFSQATTTIQSSHFFDFHMRGSSTGQNHSNSDDLGGNKNTSSERPAIAMPAMHIHF